MHKKFLNRNLESVFALGAISAIVGTGILLGAGSVYIYQKLSENSQDNPNKNIKQNDNSRTNNKNFQASC